MAHAKAEKAFSTASPFWTQPATEIARNGPDYGAGLTSAEAARRLAVYGPNAMDAKASSGLAVKILRQLVQPLVLILLVAATVSGLTGDPASVIIILTIVLISIGMDVMQEHGAERAALELRRSIAIHVTVLRDGHAIELPTERVVPGDIIRLSPGDLVPADGIVLESRSGRVNEVLLTGEPYPVEKRPGPSGATDSAEAYDALFSGTAVVSGELRMLVAATGRLTQLGGIAAALEGKQPPTAFERGLHSLGVLIVRLTIFLVLFVLLAQIAFNRPPLEAFMFAVALAVGLTPELLPMVTTVTLSRGAVRMAKRQVIIKKLSAIHDLGAMDVLCTDKTGTLTEARIELSGSPGIDGADSTRVLELAALNSHYESGVDNPLDVAILAKAGNPITSPWRKVADLPFDFERRRTSVLVEQAGQKILIVKGAPEAVLALASKAEARDGTVRPLDATLRAQLDALHESEAGNGLRLLGIAWRPWETVDDCVTVADENQLVFCGFCAFLAPPKSSAASAIARLHAQNIRVKIISGDAAPVVRHLVSSLKLNCHGLLTGDELGHLTNAALAKRVASTDC